jgi:hypothetical protein
MSISLRHRLICEMGIPLKKRIVITGNKKEWNEIIIPIL